MATPSLAKASTVLPADLHWIENVFEAKFPQVLALKESRFRMRLISVFVIYMIAGNG